MNKWLNEDIVTQRQEILEMCGFALVIGVLSTWTFSVFRSVKKNASK